MVLRKIGQKVSRLGDVIQRPRLLKLKLRGLDVRMVEDFTKPWLLNLDIRTVIDIGANTGQFARAIHEVLPAAFVYSFEPLPDCFKELQRTMCSMANFQAYNTALGENDGEATFYRSEWSPSSSLRPMGQLHKENFPYTARESREIVRVRKLDDYIDELNIKNNVLMKLDVQGCEDRVIAGGKCLLGRTKVLVVETSMVPLYASQPLFRDIYSILDQQGFKYHGALSQFASPLNGSILQADSIFINERLQS
jgi:FkbM family methyltransferase